MHPIPWVESPLCLASLAEYCSTPQQFLWAEHYHEMGYVVIEGLLADFDTSDLIAYMVAQSGSRMQDAWVECEPIKQLAIHDRVLDILRFLYGREPVPFQTLNFTRGSEQMVHSDTIHFNTIPAKWMCGVWVALEDIGKDQGPLLYYPQSHHLPEYTYLDIGVDDEEDPYAAYEEYIVKILASKKSELFTAKKGDCLIWSSNLLHGGSKLVNPDSTRYSQATHYLFDDVIPYTPRLSDQLSGGYYVREGTINIRTGEPMSMTYNGRSIFLEPLPSANHQLARIVIDGKVKSRSYLERYMDVAAVWDDPFEHYKHHGHREGRAW